MIQLGIGIQCGMHAPSGATGGVGKRVVEVLLQQGRAVRALVRDEQKGKSLLVGICSCCMAASSWL